MNIDIHSVMVNQLTETFINDRSSVNAQKCVEYLYSNPDLDFLLQRQILLTLKSKKLCESFLLSEPNIQNLFLKNFVCDMFTTCFFPYLK